MGEEGLFWRVQKHCEITPRALGCHKRQKVSPFVKFEIMLPLLCFLLDPLQISIAGHNMINLWINSRTCQVKNLAVSNYLELSKENVLGNMMLLHQPYLTWKFFMIWFFHKILKLIFQKPPSCSRNICTEHLRKLYLT